MSSNDAKTKWIPDYSHKLITDEPRLEMRLNRKARELKRLDPELDAERIRNLAIEIRTLLFTVFKVVGKGASRGVDDTFINLAKDALNTYDPSVGTPFSHYFRSIYKRRKNDAAGKDDQFFHDSLSLDGLREQRGFDLAETSSDPGQYDDLTARFSDDLLGKAPVEQIVQEEDNATEAAFTQILALTIGFLDHAVDGRGNTEKKKLYTRLFFTESITRLVKTRTTFEECAPFEKHEYETFRSMELPFQDVYIDGICRTIGVLWQTDLKEGFGDIQKLGYSWRLEADVFREYLYSATGEWVSRPAITNQRSNYKKLLSGCGFSNK